MDGDAIFLKDLQGGHLQLVGQIQVETTASFILREITVILLGTAKRMVSGKMRH